MKRVHLVALWLLGSIPLEAAEATVRLFVIGGFGQPRSGCEVENFRNLDEPLPDGGYREYRRLFRGLEASRVPYAQYEVSVRCKDGFRGGKDVQIDRPDDFEIIATSERLLRMHDRKPDLKISLRSHIKPDEVWWIRLAGMYVSSDLSAQFAAATLEATVFDPQPGRYIVMVNSSNGFSCSRRIDIYDAPRQWSFDPAGCSFGLDQQAKPVPEP